MFPCWGKAAECLSLYESHSLTGVLTLQWVYGPPGWGDDPQHDKRYQYPMLKLNPAICTIEGGMVKNRNVKIVQIIQFGDQCKPRINNLSGKRVVVTGILREAEQGYEATNIVLDCASYSYIEK